MQVSAKFSQQLGLQLKKFHISAKIHRKFDYWLLKKAIKSKMEHEAKKLSPQELRTSFAYTRKRKPDPNTPARALNTTHSAATLAMTCGVWLLKLCVFHGLWTSKELKEVVKVPSSWRRELEKGRAFPLSLGQRSPNTWKGFSDHCCFGILPFPPRSPMARRAQKW